MNSTSNDGVDTLAHQIHEALELMSWKSDPKALANRVKRLNLGLPAEDEFSMLISWMGKCKLVHKLDELQSPPESKLTYRVPDLLAIFDHDGKTISTLIEVKTSNDRSLSWRPDYYTGLMNYGQALGLPVLVAWKHPQLGWSLVDLSRFTLAKVNYKLPWETALKCNLLGILAGDFGIVLKSRVGFHLRMRKNEKVAESVDGGTTTEQWHTTVDDAYFTDCNGQRIKKLESGLWSILLAAGLEDVVTVTETQVYKGFVVPDEESIQFAQGILPLLLSTRSESDGGVKWRQVLAKHEVPCDFADIRDAAVKGIKQNIVRYVIDPVPADKPDFLPSAEVKSQHQ